MIDIESEDVEPTAIILSIGAYVITGPSEYESFYRECSINQPYRTSSPDTLKWWEDQEKLGIKKPVSSLSIIDALVQFKQWLESISFDPIIWCKGTDFDTAILKNAFTQYSIPCPWKYNRTRDFRTYLKQAKANGFTTDLVNSNPHTAVFDAMHQAKVLMEISEKLQWKLG